MRCVYKIAFFAHFGVDLHCSNDVCVCFTAVVEEEDDLMVEWFQLVTDKNDLVRKETDLVYMSVFSHCVCGCGCVCMHAYLCVCVFVRVRAYVNDM